MPTTLSNGVQVPSNGERGSVYFPILENALTQLNDHSHNGTDSELINVKYITKTTSSISSASWAAVAGQSGTYRQLVTVPTDFSFNSAEMKFFVDGGGEDGHIIYPSVEKVSSTTYYVYINDNTVNLKVTYG